MPTDGSRQVPRRRYLTAGLLPSLLAASGCLRFAGAGAGGPSTTEGAGGEEEPTATPTRTDAPTDERTAAETSTPTDGPTRDRSASAATADATLVLSHTFEDGLSDAVNDVDGRAADAGVSFPTTGQGTVLELRGGHYDIPDADLGRYLSAGDSASLSVWVNPDSLSGWQIVFNGDGLILDLRFGRVRFRWFDDGSSVWKAAAPADAALSPGRWTHLAGVLDAGERATLYADGREVARADVPDGVGVQFGQKADYARVGYHPKGESGTRYEGRLDTLRVYRGALAAASVRDLADRR